MGVIYNDRPKRENYTDDEMIKLRTTNFMNQKYKEKTPSHYNNENGSLYLFAEQHGLNAWEFDILKRVIRCRKKGEFETDLIKTVEVINLYLKEYEKSH